MSRVLEVPRLWVALVGKPRRRLLASRTLMPWLFGLGVSSQFLFSLSGKSLLWSSLIFFSRRPCPFSLPSMSDLTCCRSSGRSSTVCVSLRSRTVSHFVTALALCETTMSHCVRQIVHLSVSDVADYKASQDVSRVTN